MSHEAYQQAQTQAGAPRETEYLAFANATRALIEAMQAGREDLKQLAAAIHANRSLWDVLANDCADDTNQLPHETRAQIIGLSRWVTSYSSQVMQKRESLEPLIDVNRIMMDGLSGKTTVTGS